MPGVKGKLARTIPWWFGALVVLASWLLARPYVGLRHDGILYLGQALLHMQPEVMSRDLFFVHGSQDQFTIFARLLAQLYAVADLGQMQVAILALCHAALVFAVYRMLAPLPDEMARWLGLVALAVFAHTYAGNGIFAFAERFVTARTLAEPLAAGALFALAFGRRTLALALGLAASVVHPLVGLSAVAIGWCFLCLIDRRWMAAVALVALPAVAAWLDIAPFNGLLRRYDDVWWSAVMLANGQVLLSEWMHSDWQTVVLDLAVMVAAARFLPRPIAPLAAATAAASVLLLLVSLVGVDLLRNVLLTQLQLWRVLWFTHLFALALLPALVLRAWGVPQFGRLLAAALTAAAVAANVRWPAGWAFLALVAGVLWLAHARPPISATMMRTTEALMAVVVVGLSIAALANNVGLLLDDRQGFDLTTWTLLLFTLPTFALPLAAVALHAQRQGGPMKWLALGLAVSALAYACWHWDRRSPFTRTIESGLHQVHPFDAKIPRHAQVYWQDGLRATWVLLKRASFYTDAQAAGLLFNRATAVEAQRRRAIFDGLRLQFEVCRAMAALNHAGADVRGCAPTLPVMQKICQSENGPDFLVFESRFERGLVAEWQVPNDPAAREFFLYDCLQLR